MLWVIGGGFFMSETSAAPGHVRIDNRVITLYGARIGPDGLAVYAVLGLHAGAKTRQCYPSTRTISGLLNLSRPTVLKAICKLEEVGLIKVERRRGKGGKREVNLYTLLPVGGGQRSPATTLTTVVRSFTTCGKRH